MKNCLNVIDLDNNDKNISVKNGYIVYLNKGRIAQTNTTELKLNSLKNKNFKKKFINKIQSIITNNHELMMLDFFNLRNDKSLFISKIINILKIKKIISSKKINKIKVFSDDICTIKSFQSFPLKVEIYPKKYIFKKNKNPYFYILKFYIKVFFFLIFIKFINSKVVKKKYKECSFTLYPNFFIKNKELLYKKKNSNLLINLLITDETHNNFNFIKLIYYYITTNKILVNLESFLSFKDLYKSLLKSFDFIKENKKKIKVNFFIDNINFNLFYHNSINASLINSSKLLIYENPLNKVFKLYRFLNFNLYLFEYTLGFFLIKNIKKLSKKKVIGYQHGIFSKDLYWFDILAKLKDCKDYLPDTIISNFKTSFFDYKLLLKNNVKKYTLKKRKISMLARHVKLQKIIKLQEKILFISGTHDIKDFLYYAQHKITEDKNCNFFIKCHPKNKFLFKSTNQIKIVDRHYILKNSFTKIIISATSTLQYDLKILKKKYSIFKPDYKV